MPPLTWPTRPDLGLPYTSEELGRISKFFGRGGTTGSYEPLRLVSSYNSWNDKQKLRAWMEKAKDCKLSMWTITQMWSNLLRTGWTGMGTAVPLGGPSWNHQPTLIHSMYGPVTVSPYKTATPHSRGPTPQGISFDLVSQRGPGMPPHQRAAAASHLKRSHSRVPAGHWSLTNRPFNSLEYPALHNMFSYFYKTMWTVRQYECGYTNMEYITKFINYTMDIMGCVAAVFGCGVCAGRCSSLAFRVIGEFVEIPSWAKTLIVKGVNSYLSGGLDFDADSFMSALESLDISVDGAFDAALSKFTNMGLSGIIGAGIGQIPSFGSVTDLTLPALKSLGIKERFADLAFGKFTGELPAATLEAARIASGTPNMPELDVDLDSETQAKSNLQWRNNRLSVLTGRTPIRIEQPYGVKLVQQTRLKNVFEHLSNQQRARNTSIKVFSAKRGRPFVPRVAPPSTTEQYRTPQPTWDGWALTALVIGTALTAKGLME